MSDFLLQMKNICKSFGPNKVLDNVNFDVKHGEVHALLGENGAGKSTLIKVLGGIYRRGSGEILIEGREESLDSVREAQDKGIRIIHQEIFLVPKRTVAQNIFLGRELRNRFGLVDYNSMNIKAQQLLDSFGLGIDAKTTVGRLSIGLQQIVEIIRAVSTNGKLIVMDEPTSSLSEHEVQLLFQTIRKLKENDVGVIYISHKISELYEIADRVTVLRDGVSVGTKRMTEISSDQLIDLMVGRTLTKYYVKTENPIQGVSLEAKGLSSKYHWFADISFRAHYGEILGFSGLIGAGRSELMKTIFGIFSASSGNVELDGRELKIRKPEDALKAGIAYIPENRREEGLVLGNTVGFNMTLVALRYLLKGVKLDKDRKNRIIEDYIRQFEIKTTSQKQKVGYLSGGNQQKVVLSKWLANNPKVLILDEPTRGIDVGSKAEIYRIINSLAAEGKSIILISSELPELINMCDRVYVMREGRIAGELQAAEFSQDAIMKLAAKTGEE